MGTIHLIEGPVGSGKSTFAAQLSKEHQAPRLILDDWMATLFGADRPVTGVVEWYLERKERCIDQIWKLACDVIETGSEAVLELGLIRQSDRRQFFERVDAAGYRLKIYVLDAPLKDRRERVRARNFNRGSTYAMEVPEHVFEMANAMWEPLDESECGGFDIQFISTEI